MADAIRLAIEAMGVPIAIDFVGKGREPVAAQARQAWTRCAQTSNVQPDATLTVAVETDDSPLSVIEGAIAGADPDALLEHLSSLVTLTAIQRLAGDVLMMHACGVTHPETGLTVALVGESGAGKTTAAIALCAEYGYVTDETVVVREDLTLAPYPKPLSVITGGLRHKQQISPDALNLKVAPSTCSLARIVLLQRVDSEELRIDELSDVESLARVAKHTSYLASVPSPLHRLAGPIRSTGGVLIARYGDASQLRSLVGSLIGHA